MLCLAVLVLGVGLFLAWSVRQSLKDARAKSARASGLAAAEAGRWVEALPNLSIALARDKEDLEGLLVFAEVRSRVPEENSRHLNAARNLFAQAHLFALEQGADLDQQLEALEGRARMELAMGLLVPLEESSQEILAIDPGNAAAIDYLFQVSRIQGDFLPDDIDLVIKGERSNPQWLADLRNADDSSALRWALEQDEGASVSLDRRSRIVDVLRSGGSVDQQRIRTGRVQETTIDLAKSWASESKGGEGEVAALLLLAMEYLREGRPDEASEAISAADTLGISDPELALVAGAIFEQIGGEEGVKRSVELIETAEKAAVDKPKIASNLAIRHWTAGRSASALGIIDLARVEADENDTIDLLILAALVAAFEKTEDAREWRDRLATAVDAATIDPRMRDTYQQIVDIVDIANKNEISQGETPQAMGIAANFPGNTLVQAVYGDILASAGLQPLANAAWIRSNESVGHSAATLSQRIVRGLLEEQMVEMAFEHAVRFFQSSQSPASGIALCRAWLSLERAGLRAEEVLPGFQGFVFSEGESASSAGELISIISKRSSAREEDQGPILPLLAESGIQAKDTAMVMQACQSGLSETESFSAVIQLISPAVSVDLALAAKLCDRAEELAETPQQQDQAVIARAAVLRAQGRAEEADQVIDRRLSDRGTEDVSDRMLLAKLEQETEFGEEFEETLSGQIRDGQDPNQLLRIQRVACSQGRRQISLDVVDRLSTILGNEAIPTITAEAQHILSFEIDNPDSVRNGILRVDPVVASGSAGVVLDGMLVQLLRNAEPPQTDRALEILQDTVQKRPGRFDAAILLAELLQVSGRAEESRSVLMPLFERRDAIPIQSRRRLVTMLSRLGLTTEATRVVCEIATETGVPRDRILCIEGMDQIGERDEADQLMAELLLAPDRTQDVELLNVRRLGARGRTDEAIAQLRASQAFDEALERDLALATLLLASGRQAELGSLLDALLESHDDAPQVYLIAASHQLQASPPNTEKAERFLRQALELGADVPAVVRRVATTGLATPELRQLAEEAIAIMRSLSPDEAELLQLAFEVSPDSENFKADPNQVARIIRLIEGNPASTAAWMLAIDVLSAAYDEAVLDRDFELAENYAVELVDIANRAAGRFPADVRFPDRLWRIYSGLGRFDEALGAARETYARGGQTPRLANAVPLAALEAALDRPGAALRTLGPFLPQILEDPATRPRAWSIAVSSLLKVGRVDEAWELYQAGAEGSGGARYASWLSALALSPEPVLFDGLRRVSGDLDTINGRLIVIRTLLSAYARVASPAIRARVEEEVAALRQMSDATWLVLRAEVARSSLDADAPSLEQIERYESILDSIPTSVVEDLRGYGDLPHDQQAKMSQLAMSAVMVMNNYAAIVAEAALEGDLLDPTERERLLNRASAISEDLATIAPASAEVIDTRASVAIARGEGSKGVELAEEASRMSPGRIAFQKNLIRGLDLIGRPNEAYETAVRAIQMERRQMKPDAELLRSLTRLLEALSP